ncbi:6-bladed beta-propeller [Algoriphagus boritolerans]|uniref:6-bladed beta-propeller n=1 Tax=Algoriphagus boritolerans TaxID=308111 RepID=UPI003A101992
MFTDTTFFSKGPIGYNFVNSFNDTIYYVSENMEVFPKYYIDFGSNKVNENELIGRDYSSIVDVFQYINSSDKSYNVGNVVEFERYLLYKFFNQGIPFVSVYDKSEKNS